MLIVDISPDGVIHETFIPDPPISEEEQLKNSAIEKLKALGLTDEEVNALIGKV